MAVCLSYMEWRLETETVRPAEWRLENGDAGGCFDEDWRLVWAVGGQLGCPPYGVCRSFLGGLRFSFAVDRLQGPI